MSKHLYSIAIAITPTGQRCLAVSGDFENVKDRAFEHALTEGHEVDIYKDGLLHRTVYPSQVVAAVEAPAPQVEPVPVDSPLTDEDDPAEEENH